MGSDKELEYKVIVRQFTTVSALYSVVLSKTERCMVFIFFVGTCLYGLSFGWAVFFGEAGAEKVSS